jgi:adenylate cyclase
LRRAFAMYLSPEVVEQVIAHPEKLKLGGERRECTFLFTDLAGFTDFSERLSAEQVTSLLNMHFTRMGRIIKKHRGTLNRFIGDAIMSFWGAPLDDAAQCDRACLVAREMIIDMQAMRKELREQGLPDVRMRIGINTGMAIIGNLGSEDRFDYTAVGDCVNLAARLEGVNKLYGTEVLVSRETVSRVTADIPFRFVDRVIVKGKTASVDMFTIEPELPLGLLSAEAFERYLAQDWDACSALWRRVLVIRPDDGVAKVFLTRIAKLRETNLAPEWSGATALDKM